jgi:integrase/recombinase XerC
VFIEPEMLSQIKAQQIRNWLISLSDDSIQNRSINRKLATLRTFFKFIVRRGDIPENPMGPIKMIKVSKKLPQFIRESDMQGLWEQSPNTESSFTEVRDQLILYLLYHTIHMSML